VADEGWTAGARLYAGRPDPTWSVDATSARALRALGERLPSIERWPSQRASIGYRGCWLRAPEGARWVAYDGVVVAESDSATIGRRDAERAFERAVLQSAPAGLLPPGLAPDGHARKP